MKLINQSSGGIKILNTGGGGSDVEATYKTLAGNVLLLSGDGANQTKPTYNLLADTPQRITYVTPLTFADNFSSEVFSFPVNNPSPAPENLYDYTNNTLLENSINGQEHWWRITFSYSAKAANTAAEIIFRFFNPETLFETKATVPLSRTATNDTALSTYIGTTATLTSIAPPVGTGYGYQMFVTVTNTPLTFTLQSIKRISDANKNLVAVL